MTADTLTKPEIKIRMPKMWKVILHNDDRTPMDFVVALLIEVFQHHPLKATEIMLNIHEQGGAVVGIYTHEIAEEKAALTKRRAEVAGYPLTATIEEDD